MYDFPIKYFENNLIFNDNKKECWAVFKMIGYNYDFKSVDSKISILNSMGRFIANSGKEAMFDIIPVAQDVNKHYDRLIDNLNKEDTFYKQGKNHALHTKTYLNERLKNKGDANDYNVYVLTKLDLGDTLLEDFKDWFQYFIKEPFQAIEEFMDVGYRDIYEKEINMFLKMSNEFLRKQRRRANIVACNEMEIEWLLRRPYFRGMTKSIVLRSTDDKHWSPYVDRFIKNGEKVVRGDTRQILQLTEGIIYPQSDDRCLKFEHDAGTAYQTFLTVAHIPDGIVFPGGEWLLTLQDFPFQTEVIIRITMIEHRASLKKIDSKKKEIKDQIDHIIESDDELPDELVNSKEYANDLEAELRASKSPLAETSITFCLASENKEKLEANVDFIKEFYIDNNFVIERPLTDQLKLFMESIPGTPRYVRDYIQPIPPRTLAGGIIGATRMLGDNCGPYIGTTGLLKKNVYLDVTKAPKLNASASAGFYGTLGGGKSFAANSLFYLTVLYGAMGLVIDPKGERTNWLKDLPEFKGHINVTTLSSDEEDRGKLDPFLIYRDNFDMASYLAIAILCELFSITSKDDDYLVILEAMQWLKIQERKSMTVLADKLMDFGDDEYGPIARKLGRKIQLLRDTAMAGLLFGNGDEKGLDFKKKINIIQIQNLNMPKPETPKEEYTQEELLSTVLMIPIASFARKFIHQDRRLFKIVLLDEAWALESNSAGKQMMNALIKEGRALNSGCFFISQSTKDVKQEGVKTNITYKFCFKAREINEIKSVLEFLDLEITDENIEVVKNLQNGQCLFQDLDRRVGILQFDAVFSHLIDKAFNTNPDKVIKEGKSDEKE